MNKIKKGLENQAIGLLPLLLFIFLDNYFSYLLSFVVGVTFCVVSIFLYQLLRKDNIYQFMLLPAATTLVLYAVFLCLKLEPVLFIYSPLITEILLVVVLTFIGFTRRMVVKKIRSSVGSGYKRTLMRTTLNEFYFIAQVVQNIYTLHLFVILVYSILPDTMQSTVMERFLYRELGVILGMLIIFYEEVRLTLMRGSLEKEMWLPIVNDAGRVEGCIARSVSRSVPKKYCHPIIRIAVVHEGMLYLVKRSKDDFVSPDTMDYPFDSYVLFKHSMETSLRRSMGRLGEQEDVMPHFLVRYRFENEKVKHLVSLYVICLHTEEEFSYVKKAGGKLWTAKQIEENLHSGIFSEYFEKEFEYIQTTVLLAQRACAEK